MQRLGSPWTFHRLSTNSNLSLRPIVRRIGTKKPWPVVKRVPTKKEFPQFDINPLLLNLIAEDAKNVRNYDPKIDGVPEGRLAKKFRDDDLMNARIAAFEHEYQQDEARRERVFQEDRYALQINECDILSTALKGLPQAPSRASTDASDAASKSSMVGDTAQSLMKWNGIPQHAIHDTSKAVPYMLRRKEQAAQLAPFRDIARFDAVIINCKNFDELQRTVHHILELPVGSQLISQLSDTLGQSCSNIEDSHSPSDILAFLNDVWMNLSSRDLPVGEKFVNVALHLAVACSSFSAARMYMRHLIEVGGHESSQTSTLSELLSTLLLHATGNFTGSRDRTLMPAIRERRAEVFSLLTGASISGRHHSHSVSSVVRSGMTFDSKGTLINKQHSYNLFKIYMDLFGELGALRSMWYAWQWITRFTTHGNEKQIRKPAQRTGIGIELPMGSDVLISAFTQTVYNVIERRISMHALMIESATGIFEEDCQADLRTILRSTRITEVAPLLKNKDNTSSTNGKSTVKSSGEASQKATSELADQMDSKRLQFAEEYGPTFQGEIVDAFSRRTIQESMAQLYELLKSAELPARPTAKQQRRLESF